MSTKDGYICRLAKVELHDKNGNTIINITDPEILKTITISIDSTEQGRMVATRNIGLEIQCTEIEIEHELRRENEYNIEFYEKMANKHLNNKRLSELVEKLKRLDAMKKSINIKSAISIING